MITDSTFAVGCFQPAPGVRFDARALDHMRAQNRLAEQLFKRPCPDPATFEALVRPARAADP